VSKAKPASTKRDVTVMAADVGKMSFAGESAGTATLDLKIARPEVAKGLVHKYVVMVRQNARRGTASTLTKAEVRGGGRKPFKQKGTGNARAGSTRTPLKPGGGVIFGPKPKDWSIKMNKKERRLAMATALQSCAEDMIVVDDLSDKVGAQSFGVLVESRCRGLGGYGFGVDFEGNKLRLGLGVEEAR
jgi:large subunit ribosomal protein L4